MVFSKASRFAASYCLKRTTMKTVFIPLVLLAMVKTRALAYVGGVRSVH